MVWLDAKDYIATAAGALGLVFSAAAASAADDVTLKIEARPDAAAAKQVQFNVSGGSGRYDHADVTQVSVPMALHAEMSADADDRKIVASVVFLKSSDKTQVSAFDGKEPQADVTLDKTFTFQSDAKSKLSQDAVAACNSQFPAGAQGNGAAIATVRVSITWRVTTGKFNFRWRDYDTVAPSEDFVKNPDFYAERTAFEQEKSFEIKVGCSPLNAQPVARNPTPTAPAESSAMASPAVPPAPIQPTATASPGAAPRSDMLPMKPIESNLAPEPERPQAQAPLVGSPPAAAAEKDDRKSDTITPAMAASVSYTASPKRPVCTGGNIRQIHSGPDAFLCLCPANATRIETGDNAFSCRDKR